MVFKQSFLLLGKDDKKLITNYKHMGTGKKLKKKH